MMCCFNLKTWYCLYIKTHNTHMITYLAIHVYYGKWCTFSHNITFFLHNNNKKKTEEVRRKNRNQVRVVIHICSLVLNYDYFCFIFLSTVVKSRALKGLRNYIKVWINWSWLNWQFIIWKMYFSRLYLNTYAKL